MGSDDTAGIPEPTEVFVVPPGARPKEASNLAWSTDDDVVEPQPFKPQTRRFDWYGWAGPVLPALTAVIATIWVLNSLLNHVRQSHVAPSRGTAPETPGYQVPASTPVWREPPWGPFPSAALPRPAPTWVSPLPSAASPLPVPTFSP